MIDTGMTRACHQFGLLALRWLVITAHYCFLKNMVVCCLQVVILSHVALHLLARTSTSPCACNPEEKNATVRKKTET